MRFADVGRTGRSLAYRMGLHRSRAFVFAYGWVSDLQYRGAWNDEIDFRGSRFLIGEDRSLYPAVRRGWFEADELDALLPRVEVDDVVWDVGANVGLYSVLLATRAARGHVVAFEPVPDTRARLADNLARNTISNVTVEGVALSSSEGRARMAVNDDSHGCDHITMAGEGGLEVRTVRGDNYVATSPHGDPRVIKVDIEGHEPDFLLGCRELIARARPVLMIEVNPTTWATSEMRESFADVVGDLFSIYGDALWIRATGASRVDSFDAVAHADEATTLLFDPLS